MPVIELVERMAFAVRNDLSVSSRAPASNAAFCSGPGPWCGRTDLHDLGDDRSVVLEMFAGLHVLVALASARSVEPRA